MNTLFIVVVLSKESKCQNNYHYDVTEFTGNLLETKEED